MHTCAQTGEGRSRDDLRAKGVQRKETGEEGSTVKEAESRGEKKVIWTEAQHGKGKGCEAYMMYLHARNGV